MKQWEYDPVSSPAPSAAHRDSIAREERVAEAVCEILNFIGEDPAREGLLDTPKRVMRMWEALTAGYRQDPTEILSRTFSESGEGLVVLSGIRFASVCEHHLLPFVGTAAVGYLPDGKIVGLSKLARLVECFAARLQVQERLTREIATALATALQPRGVGVLLRAHHFCMGCRGVRQPASEMTTTAFLGDLRGAVAQGLFLREAEK